MSAKKRTEEGADSLEIMDAFVPDMTKANSAFDMKALVAEAVTKSQESGKFKIAIAERIKKAKEGIARIQNMIGNLELKSQQQSGLVWVNLVIRPLVAELCNVLPGLKAEMIGPYGIGNDLTLTMYQRGPIPGGKRPESRSITFVTVDSQVSIRDFSESSQEWAPGTREAISNFNFRTIPIPVDKPIEFLIEHLR